MTDQQTAGASDGSQAAGPPLNEVGFLARLGFAPPLTRRRRQRHAAAWAAAKDELAQMRGQPSAAPAQGDVPDVALRRKPAPLATATAPRRPADLKLDIGTKALPPSPSALGWTAVAVPAAAAATTDYFNTRIREVVAAKGLSPAVRIPVRIELIELDRSGVRDMVRYLRPRTPYEYPSEKLDQVARRLGQFGGGGSGS